MRAALQAIRTIVPGATVHATGYCLGGTLLATVAAALGRTDGTETPLKTLTLLAAQTDLTAPGEIGLFIDEGQVASLENLMAQRGYLDKKQMQGTFQMLRSNDLIWSHRLQSQLLGQRRPLSDLMAWNADGTRLPARMHSEYLRGMYLNNALARGEWRVDGKPVHLSDIRVPIFNVGTAQDHVAPWRSVFRLHALTNAEQTFVITTGGRQRRHRQSAGAGEVQLSVAHVACRRPAADARRLAGGDRAGIWHVVDGLGEMAAPALDTPSGAAIHRSGETGPAATGCRARPECSRALTCQGRVAHAKPPGERRSPCTARRDAPLPPRACSRSYDALKLARAPATGRLARVATNTDVRGALQL